VQVDARCLPFGFAFRYSFRCMAKKTQSIPKSFEEAMNELEQILSEIEAGEVGLEQSLVRYERGMFLLQHCRNVLGQAEKQIELLSKTDAGDLRAQPLEPEAPAEQPE
jgi:exodeoxyribonuclease VII small subunit